MTTATASADGGSTVTMGRRFLPLPAVSWPPTASGRGLLELPVAPGTPVHAVSDGRVVEAAAGITGEVVIRDGDEHLLHYRRLLPSSVQVQEGGRVTAGDLLGVVGAPAKSGETPTVAFGIKSASDDWLDATEELVGAADPDELFRPILRLSVDPLSGNAPAMASAPGPTARRSRRPEPAVGPAPAPEPSVTSEPAAAPERSREPAGRERDRRRRRPADPKRIATGVPVAPTPPATGVPVAPTPPATGGNGGPQAADADVAPQPLPGPDDTSAPATDPGTAQHPPEPNEVFRKLAGRSPRKER